MPNRTRINLTFEYAEPIPITEPVIVQASLLGKFFAARDDRGYLHVACCELVQDFTTGGTEYRVACRTVMTEETAREAIAALQRLLTGPNSAH